MRKYENRVTGIVSYVLVIFLISSVTAFMPDEAWKAPVAAKSIINPLKNNAE